MIDLYMIRSIKVELSKGMRVRNGRAEESCSIRGDDGVYLWEGERLAFIERDIEI